MKNMKLETGKCLSFRKWLNNPGILTPLNARQIKKCHNKLNKEAGMKIQPFSTKPNIKETSKNAKQSWGRSLMVVFVFHMAKALSSMPSTVTNNNNNITKYLSALVLIPEDIGIHQNC
jgi:hypothetical protein